MSHPMKYLKDRIALEFGGKCTTAVFSTAHRGFTLIELLVVIAILSLLVSILLPTLSKARQLARALVCMTTIRSITMADEFYASESDDWLTPIKVDTPVFRTWMENPILRRSVGVEPADPDTGWNAAYKKVCWNLGFICPDAVFAKKAGEDFSAAGKIGEGYGHVGYSYGFNSGKVHPASSISGNVAYKQSEIPNPSGFLKLVDALDWNPWPSLGTDCYTEELPGSITGQYGVVAYRHDSDNLSRTNVGFFDGHVETMDRNDVGVVDKPENAHSLWLFSR